MVRKDAEFDRRENGFCVIARHDIYMGLLQNLKKGEQQPFSIV